MRFIVRVAALYPSRIYGLGLMPRLAIARAMTNAAVAGMPCLFIHGSKALAGGGLLPGLRPNSTYAPYLTDGPIFAHCGMTRPSISTVID